MNNQLSKNEFLKFKKLQNKKYRNEFSEFIIEGKHLIDEALKNKNLIKLIITSNLDYKNSKVEVKYCSYNQICKLSTTTTPQDIIAICNFLNFDFNIDSDLILALDEINDPGNLGTLIRTAYSFGIKNVIVKGVDIYNPKVLRSSQGSIFKMNLLNTNNLKYELLNLKSKGYLLVGSLLDKSAISYEKLNLDNKKAVLILGNEANGISVDIKKILDEKIYIPIDFESLNVAIAGGILMAKYSKLKK